VTRFLTDHAASASGLGAPWHTCLPPKRDSPLAPWLAHFDTTPYGIALGAYPLQGEVRATGTVPSRKGTDWILTNLIMCFSIHAPNGKAEVQRRVGGTASLNKYTHKVKKPRCNLREAQACAKRRQAHEGAVGSSGCWAAIIGIAIRTLKSPKPLAAIDANSIAGLYAHRGIAAQPTTAGVPGFVLGIDSRLSD
jgi:hypothetical protein